ncbi:TonB-dependent receptor plug domain-containing protein [Neptunicella marina]|uniref:TonB-dependent receptor n=1 Tax=Neptunicella marina TaxID=2125989 RepID=A0A8J6J171_9ALTE|nr:TonB-dependent receptor [Neptunicella marina]MBC3767743.1 TonB-dependent receptor [Neptunicella marina]
MIINNKVSCAVKTALATCALGSAITMPVIAQEAQAPDGASDVEKVIITGTRGAPRSVQDSPVPVDVFSEDDLEAVAFTDTNDVLKTLVPSYTLQRQPISDGASFIRPASLRGMPTDKTLVLVNSKRRHRSALVQIGGSGTQGPDVATIPSSALKTIEVLRDGAAAQYGSDAIAGVINFVLKDNDEGGSLSAETGQYYEGDGTMFTLTGNMGFALGADGFLSISAEVSDSDSTNRGTQYCDTWFCLDPSSDLFDPDNAYTADPAFMEATKNANLGGEDVVQPWGQPNASATRLFFNAGYELNANTKLYGFGNYSKSEADGSFYYRYPGNGTIEDLRQEDGSIYSPLEKYPGGFTPRFFGDITDYSLVGGIEGEFGSEVGYDLSARFGSNKIEYTLKNTINPSMAAASPTEFHPGDLINDEMQLSADFSKYVGVGLYSDLLVAFGLTYMEESYELVGGNPESYEAGPHAVSDPFGFCDGDTATAAGLAVIANGSTLDCADSSDPVYTVVGVGSNGFPGYSPEFSGKYERDMSGIYVDLSADINESLFMQGAMRYEDYSDFGSELVGKIAFKYTLTDDFNMRGSVGTGFRAPTPGQQGTTNVSTRLPNGLPVATGLFPALSAVGQALGAKPLDPEKSLNYTLGFTGSIDDLKITLDFYQIELEDRFYAVSTRDVSTDPTSGDAYANYLALAAANVAGAESIGGVNYFQNAFDTVTKGMDFVATYTMGDTIFTGSLNYNKTELDSDPSEYLNAEDQFDLENSEPSIRSVLSVRHSFDDLSLMVRANYYGSYENYDGGFVQKYDPIVFLDLELKYQVTENMSIAVGGRNLLDEYPEKDTVNTYGDDCCGAVYWASNTVDWQGGYYYARANYEF